VIRRYIDDYIIFANKVDVLDDIQRVISDSLLQFNLHLNEGKTHTISRPLQTRRSQIISGATPALNKFRENLQKVDLANQIFAPNSVRNPKALVRTFANDIKVACTNGSAGYEDVSPYIVGSLSSTIEFLIGSYNSVPRAARENAELYAKAFDALISALYYFFTVHATVTSSYQVAKSTVLTVRFCNENLPDASDYVHERVRLLIQGVISNPSLLSIAMSECVPIEMLNVILASAVLPEAYRIDFLTISNRVLQDDNLDYFSIVSLLFYFGSSNKEFATKIEEKLRKQFLPKAMPKRVSQDAHMLLDLVACPHLSKLFKRECVELLLSSLDISATRFFSTLLVQEIGQFPWFVNWSEIDLLNHLRKKELRQVY
jgi:hypothetical protein